MSWDKYQKNRSRDVQSAGEAYPGDVIEVGDDIRCDVIAYGSDEAVVAIRQPGVMTYLYVAAN